MSDLLYWYTGLIVWLLAGAVTLLVALGWFGFWLMEKTLWWFWTEKEFIAFVYDRLNSGKTKAP